jgi:hypothetical protein
MSHENRPMDPYLDKFQRDKRARMKYLFNELKEGKKVTTEEFLGSIAVHHGIRRTTGEEYLRDWMDSGYITIDNNKIRLVRKPESPIEPVPTQENKEETRKPT